MTHVPKSLYLVFAIVGTVVPWIFFAQFFMKEGFDVVLFIQSLFVNGAAAGFSIDVLLSILVFWIWSYVDAQKNSHTKLVVSAACRMYRWVVFGLAVVFVFA